MNARADFLDLIKRAHLEFETAAFRFRHLGLGANLAISLFFCLTLSLDTDLALRFFLCLALRFLSRLALAGKVATGTPASEIVAKELSLGGVQRPLDPGLVDGWGEAVEFFRFGDFAGWIIEGYE